MSGEIPATCELWIDGTRYPDGSTGSDPADPSAVTGLTVHWGRENTIDQPAPATCTFTVADPPGGTVRFDDTVFLGSTVVIWSAVAGTRVVVFGGRVTDLTASWDDGGSCDVVAADLLADLANRFVGAEPWATELLWERAIRVLTAVNVSTAGLTLDHRPAVLPVSRMDVDRQPAAGLLLELATTGGAVLWPAYDPAVAAPYLFYEDPAGRASLYSLEQHPDTLLWAPAAVGGAGTALSACNVLRDPVSWVRAVTDLITRVAVRWLDQTSSPGTTERSVTLVDDAAETTYGARGLSVGTILTSNTDASTLASAVLAAHQPSPTWRAAGLSWDLADTADPADPVTVDLARRLLDNTARSGLALGLLDLPEWTPTSAAVSLYVEGGDYRFDGGRWLLALSASPASGLGGSMSFDTFNPTVRFVDMDRAVSYLDLVGVGPTVGAAADPGDVVDQHPAAAVDDAGPLAVLPVPTPTDPVADGAAHITALADAIGATIHSRSVAYYTGNVTTNANADFITPGIAGVLSVCSGAFVSDNSPAPHLFNFLGAGQPGNTWVRVYSRTGAPATNTTLNVCVIAYGTPA